MTRYRFDDVRAALHKHWGFDLRRGAVADAKHDGRWTVEYSRTGYVARTDRGFCRFATLADVVRVCELAAVLKETV